MTPKTLRVRANGDASVPNYEALDSGRTSFIGRKYVEKTPGEWAFEATGEVVEVPYRVEYVRELKGGGLVPADDATAKAAGLELHAASNQKDGDL